VGSAAHRDLAREVAARSVVLLRNEQVDGRAVLPLPDDASVAVVGRLADTVNLGDNGSSDVWDLECRTVLDGLRGALGAGRVVHDDGSDRDRAAAAAAGADVAIVVVGYTYLDEGEYIGETEPALRDLFPPGDEPEVVDRFRDWVDGLPPTTRPERLAPRQRGFSIGGDRTSLRLSDDDVALIRAVAAANPRTVVAVQAGSAVVAAEWIDAVPAVVQSWYGGCEAGPGLADVLTGAVNPSARLPFSVPADEGDLPAFDRDATSFTYDRWHGWWHLARTGATPMFPFGSGLSYTTFELADVEVATPGPGDPVVVSGSVRNTGARDGAEVVQVYASLPDPDAPPRLVGFARIEVPAGTSVAFTISVPLDRLDTRDATRHAWSPPTGTHRFTVGRHAGDPAATAVDVEL
jgi:beta-glucosidase